MLLLDRLPLRFSSQPAAEPAVLTFVTHGMARRHSLFSRSLFVIILDRVACSGSRKCQVRTTHNTGKHRIELDVDCILFLIDKLRPGKEKSLRLFFHTTVAYFLVHFSKIFKIYGKSVNELNVFCCSVEFLFKTFLAKINTWRVNGTCAQERLNVFVLRGLHICPVLNEDRAGQQVLLYTVFQVFTASVHQMMAFFAFLHHAAVNGSGILEERTVSIFRVTYQLWVDAAV